MAVSTASLSVLSSTEHVLLSFSDGLCAQCFPPSPPPSLPQCTYINGSPQNTFVPGVVELAEREKVFLGGDDFKSGQTKIKSVLVEFLVLAGLKVREGGREREG